MARPRSEVETPQVGRAHAVEAAAMEAAKVRAVRVVAARSTGVDDCRELLDMLGLGRTAGLQGDGPDPFDEVGDLG